MKRYSEYKDSGVEWIGEIPSHWNITKLKYISEITRGAILRPVDNPNFYDENGHWTYLNIADVTSCDKYLNYASTKLSLLGSRKSARVEKGNLILTASATIGKPFINNIDVCIHDGFIAFKKIDININYLFYFLKNKIIFDNMGKSNTQKNIYLDEVKDVNITIPMIREQEQIVKYLDKKTLQIEALISKKEELIETLKASRTKLISETVTKGLDKDVPMKDSGVEWIGEIPSHWKVCKLKHILKSKITDGPHETPNWVDEGIPFLSAEAIVNSEISIKNMRGYITESKYEEYSKKSKVYKNDILFCKSGSTTGKSALVKTDDIFGIWSPLAIIRADENKINYSNLFYFIQSEYFMRQVVNYWTFGTQPNIGMGTLENLHIACSENIDEQVEIVNFLDRETNKIDNLISKVEEQIEVLKKAKQKLITEVVTGKIDVTNL